MIVAMVVAIVGVVKMDVVGFGRGSERQPGVTVRAVMVMLVSPESMAVSLGPVHDASV